MVDRELIEEKLALLQERAGRLKGLQGMTEEAYLGDFDAQRIAERCLETAVQAMLDIGNHLIVALGLERPRDYRGVFDSLVRGGVLDGSLLPRLRALAGLRNRLVHQYGDLDHRILRRDIDKGLADFADFARAIQALLDPPRPG